MSWLFIISNESQNSRPAKCVFANFKEIIILTVVEEIVIFTSFICNPLAMGESCQIKSNLQELGLFQLERKEKQHSDYNLLIPASVAFKMTLMMLVEMMRVAL